MKKKPIEKLKKPSDTNVKALAKLFPACGSGKKRTLDFDPSGDCVASENQRRKKAATPGKGRSKCVKVEELPACFPKGPIRDRLTKIGCIKEISFTRVMSDSEVCTVVLERFKEFGVKKFQYLKAQKDNSLKIAILMATCSIVGIQFDWIRFITHWSRSGPGWYCGIKITKKGDWPKEVVRCASTM